MWHFKSESSIRRFSLLGKQRAYNTIALAIGVVFLSSCISGDVKHELVSTTPPLHDLIVDGASIDQIKAAIKRDPSVIGVTRNHGESNLYSAVTEKGADIAKVLLEAGEDPNYFFNDPPLMVAIRQENVAMIQLLLEHKADPDKRFGPFKMTPREIATDSENAAVARLFRRESKQKVPR